MNNNIQFQVRNIENVFTNKILDLLKSSLGANSDSTKKTTEFWNWKHNKSPFGKSWGNVALDTETNKIAGLRVLMYWNLVNREGGQARCVRAVDTATHPDYQRKGIFTTLTKNAIESLSKDGVDIVFNTPNKNSKLGYLKMGWTDVTSWPLYISVQNPLKFVWGITYGRKNIKANTIPDWQSVFSDQIIGFKELITSYSDLNIFLKNCIDCEISIEGWKTFKDITYFSWRYGAHPGVKYGFCVLHDDNNNIKGIAVLRPNTRFGLNELVVCDLLYDYFKPSTGKALIKKVKQETSSDYLIAHYNFHTCNYKLIKSAGFIKAPKQAIDFTVRELSTDISQFSNPNKWNLSLGDLEMF